MPTNSTKGRLLRLCLVAICIIGVAGLLIYSQRHQVAHALLKQRLEPLEKKYSLDVRIENLNLESFSSVKLETVSVAHEGRARARIRDVSVVLEAPSLTLKAPKPMGVELGQVELFIDSGGHAAGLVSDLSQFEQLKGKFKQKAAKATHSASTGRLSQISVKEVVVRDQGKWADIRFLNSQLKDGQISTQMEVNSPLSARCSLSGNLETMSVDCTSPIRVGHERFGFVTIASARLQRKPELQLDLENVGIELSKRVPSFVRSVFEGVRANISVKQPNAQTGMIPVGIAFLLPGGGRVDGTGQVGPLGGKLQAAVTNLNFGDETTSASGRLSGNYTLELSTLERALKLFGEGSVESFVLSHEALAEDIIGPFDMSVSGTMNARHKDDKFTAEVTKGEFRLGSIVNRFSGSVHKTHDDWRVGFELEAESVEFADFASSIPPNLLPNLEDMVARGPLGASVKVGIDSQNLDDTVLDIKIDTHKFVLKELPKALDFFALRHVFKTSFAMPENDEGEIVTLHRLIGPGVERFVALDEMTPLLPLAVMAQEDASFLKHKGFSLFHLRGSLIDNLKKGRFVRGGSTVTMQLARNLFLNRKKNLSRKVEEIVVAWLLEQYFDKDELMTLYLNAVEFGPDIFGVGEASQHYFGISPKSLSPAQTAWLIKLLPGPRLYYKQFEDKRLSRSFKDNLNWLMRHMIRKGFLDESDYEPVTETSLFEVTEPSSGNVVPPPEPF